MLLDSPLYVYGQLLGTPITKYAAMIYKNFCSIFPVATKTAHEYSMSISLLNALCSLKCQMYARLHQKAFTLTSTKTNQKISNTSAFSRETENALCFETHKL